MKLGEKQRPSRKNLDEFVYLENFNENIKKVLFNNQE
jgi:hypothetical protein